MSNSKSRIPLKYTLEEMMDAMYEYGGVIKDMSKHMQCSRRTVYEYMDRFPELKEAQLKAEEQLDKEEVETAFDGLNKLMSMADEDTTVAFKAYQLIVTKSKKSKYYAENNDQTLKKLDEFLNKLDENVDQVTAES